VSRPADSLSLMDAIEEVFPSSTNVLVLEWGGVSVPLSFKYDVSWILLDAIEMIEQMLSASTLGVVSVLFPSSSFQVEWEITALEDDGIEINATWNSVAGSVEGLLADRSPLRTEASAFIAEWRHLFAVVVRAIDEAQMPVEMIQDYDRLLKLSLAKHPDPGTPQATRGVKESGSGA